MSIDIDDSDTDHNSLPVETTQNTREQLPIFQLEQHKA